MTTIRKLFALAFFLAMFLAAPIVSADTNDPDPLFASNEVLNVRIVAPFEIIRDDRSSEEYIEGKFHFTNGAGEPTVLDVGIRARGRFRRQQDVCPFPPMRLNFKKSQVKGSLFSGQDKLKLVTHCTTSSYRNEQAVFAEFLAYRILNQLTDISFRVRLLHIEYATPDNDKTVSAYGFFIEHDRNVAKRIGSAPLKIEKIPIENLDQEHLSLVSVFQYLIGNTDFSAVAGSPGAECCHNHSPFGIEGEVWYSIPYDFDMSGIVDAPYAAPNPVLRLDSVQERLYRGRCSINDLLPNTLATFVAKREDIESVVHDLPEMSSKKRSDVLKYIDQYYRSVKSPRGVKRNLIRKCK